LLHLDVDESYTASQRRRHGGHGSDDVYDRHYAPTNLEPTAKAHMLAILLELSFPSFFASSR
jgi:hypothetical protein